MINSKTKFPMSNTYLALQIEGTCSVTLLEGSEGEPLSMSAGSICVFGPGKTAYVKREADSVGLLIRQDPKGNRVLGSGAVASETQGTAADQDNKTAQDNTIKED
jgi:hypothetical protein